MPQTATHECSAKLRFETPSLGPRPRQPDAGGCRGGARTVCARLAFAPGQFFQLGLPGADGTFVRRPRTQQPRRPASPHPC